RFDAASADALRELLRAVAVFAAGGRRALENLATNAGGEVKLLADQMKT
ncbi:MAG: VWA domain-containing protein, partial [Rhodospirillaceae bacterium]|nr:VWA domain-containing protein [Rhodospirillaceae bacterium]